MELKNLETLLQNISHDYRKHVEFELSILALNSPDSNDLTILIDSHSEHIEKKIIPAALFKSFKVLNGELFVETGQAGINDITFTDKIMEHQTHPILSSVVIPIDHAHIGHGAMLISSYSPRLLSAKAHFKNIQAADLFTKYSEHLTEQEKADPEQVAENNLFQNFFQYSAIPTVVCNLAGDIQYANSAFETISGFNNNEFIIKQTLQNFIPDQSFNAILSNPDSESSENSLSNAIFQSRNGNESTVNLKISRLPDQEHILIHIVETPAYKENSIEEIEWSDKFQTINTILNNIFTKSKLDDLLDNIHFQLKEYFEFDYAAIAVYTKSASRLQVHLFHGNKYNRLSFTSSKTAYQFQQLFDSLKNIETSEQMMPDLFAMINRPVKKKLTSQLGMKLHAPDNFGMFCFGSVLHKAYSQFHTDILTGIGYPLACTVTKISIFEELTQYIGHLESINSICHQLNQMQDVKDIPHLIHEQSKKLFKADHCEIEIFNHTTHNRSIDFIKTYFRSQRDKAIEQLQPLIIENIFSFVKKNQMNKSESSWRSFFIFPIESEQKGVAAAYLFFKKTCRMADQDVTIAQLFFQRTVAILIRAICLNRLIREKEKSENMLKLAADPVICLDGDGQLIYCNDRFLTLSGYNFEEINHRTLDTFLLNGNDIFNQIRSQLHEGPAILTIDTDLCRKDETFVIVDWSFGRIKDQKKDLKYYMGVGKDISERLKHEMELEQQCKDLEELMYKISHRLKTPLVSHDGYISLIENEATDRLTDAAKHYLKRLRENNDFMSDVINDLLDYRKYQKKTSKNEQINTKQLLNLIIHDLMGAENVLFHVNDNLPDLLFDREDLQTIFTNLIENAIKYIGHPVRPRIEIGGKKENDRCQFYVKDNGIGIAEKYHKHIFDLFFRVNDQNTVNGTGVGLTLVNNIIKKNNGELHVDSAPGKGTTIYFTIPDLTN